MSEMTRAQKIRAFNESNAPFYLVDHTDEVSLCCVFHPMPDSVFSLGQEAFNRYAERIGFLKDGRFLTVATPAEILNSPVPEVQAFLAAQALEP